MSRPDPDSGYCLDDNARALIVAIRAHMLTGESGLLDYVRHYLAFVERCQLPDGRFRSSMASDGSWLDADASEISQGRAVWGLGFAAGHTRQIEVRLRSLRCLDRWLASAGQLTSSRGQAFALLGLQQWSAAEPSPALDALAERLASELAGAYERCSSPDWRWFEDELSSCGARLPQALLGTPFSALALESLVWLCAELEADGGISLIGSRGPYRRGGQRAVYDQRAVDAAALISACAAAHRLSGEERFRQWAELAFAWFAGENVGRRPMIDPDTGGCFDALTPDGVDLNQSAESLLSWLLAWEDMAEIGWA